MQINKFRFGLFVSVLGLGCATSLHALQAADLDDPVIMATDWTGIYVGAHAGMVSGSTRGTHPLFVFSGYNSEPAGVAGGLLGGYNWQFGNVVAGIEVDYTFSDAGDGVDNAFWEATVELDHMASLRARLGYAVDDTMLYVTGGLAWANVHYEAPIYLVDESQTFHGYQVGAGVEHRLNNALSIRGEYLYGHYGEEEVLALPFLNYSVSQSLQTHTFRAALNWNFNSVDDQSVDDAQGNPVSASDAWTGFYVGAHAGMVSGSTRGTFDNYIGYNSEPAGVAGGLLGGYNWQFGNVVAGIEVDYTFSDAGDGVDNASWAATVELDHMASLRARLGYAVDDTMLYVTGGLAWANVHYESPVYLVDESQTFHGYQVGAGVEHRLNNALSIRGEYLYGHYREEEVWALPFLYSVSQSLQTHTFRAALNWNFNPVDDQSADDGQGNPVSASDAWTGFYAGAHVGMASGSTRGIFWNIFGYNSEPAGVAGGLLGGYNWQFGNVVAGIEVDYAFSDAGDGVDNSGRLATVEIDHMASLRGRLGYAVDDTLLYITGGLAWANVHYEAPVNLVDESQTFHGYQVGAGVEHRLNNALSIRGEYLYGHYREEEVWALPFLNYSVSQSLQTHTFRAALVWSFGS